MSKPREGLPSASPSAVEIGTTIELLRRFEALQCGRAAARSPAEAQGLALSGVASASVGGGRSPGTLPLPAGASCVHHLISGESPADSGCAVLVPSSPAEALQMAGAARRISARLRQPVICRISGSLAADLAAEQLPSTHSFDPGAPSDDLDAVVKEELAAMVVSPMDDDPVATSNALLAAVPEGPWARDLCRAVLAAAVEAGKASSGRAPRAERRAAGAAQLSWRSSDEASPDLLLVGSPNALNAAALAALRPGAAVLLRSPAGSAEAAAHDLGASLGGVIRDRGFSLHWLPASEGSGDEDAATQLVAAAASLLDAGATPKSMISVPAEALQPDALAEEVDFLHRDDLPRWPEETGEDAARWRPALRDFHLGGEVDTLPTEAPGTPVRSLAALAWAEATTPNWPLLVDEDASGDDAWARPLGAALKIVIAEQKNSLLADLQPLLLHALGSAVPADSETASLRSCFATATDALIGLLEPSEATAGTLRDDLASLEAALPRSSSVLPLRPGTEALLPLMVAQHTQGPYQRSFRVDLRDAAEQLRNLLVLDRLGGADTDGENSAASLGLASRFFDPGALAKGTPAQPSSATLSPERREQIEAALAVLDEALDAPDQARVHVLCAPGSAPSAVDLLNAKLWEHPDPLAAAAGLFDGLAARAVGVARALRSARLLANGDDLDSAKRERLDRLDWEGLSQDELAALPPLLVFVDGRTLRDGALAGLSLLLRSSRPVRVIVSDGEDADDEAGDLSRYHAGLGWIGVAHREAYVLQSSLARPDLLITGLAEMISTSHPGLAVLRRAQASGAEAILNAELALAGRAWPELRYDPAAGDSWADRLSLAGNPQPEKPWPTVPFRCRRDGEEVEEQVTLTFADAVAEEDAFRPHLRSLQAAAWCEEQEELGAWLQTFRPGDPPRSLPVIYSLRGDGLVERAAISRSLALASRDHARAWRLLQELAGHGNVHADRAASRARSEAEQQAALLLATLRAEHSVELDRVAAETGREAMEQLASILLDMDGAGVASMARGLTGGGAPTSGPPPEDPPTNGVSAAAAPPPTQEEEEEEEEDFGEEAYLDSMLCTTCNECININPKLFAYNGDKQAELGDLKNGSFAELVKAAELCPARCIHPGKPIAGDSTATPDLVQRAAAFS